MDCPYCEVPLVLDGKLMRCPKCKDGFYFPGQWDAVRKEVIVVVQVTVEKSATAFKLLEQFFDQAAQRDSVEWIKLESAWNITYVRESPPGTWQKLVSGQIKIN